MIRVLLVDDQAVVRAGFRMFLEMSGDVIVVGEAADGPAAVRLARELAPDVVCMDVRMPGGDGLEATRAIVAGPEPVPAVLVVTTFDLDEYVFGALEAGASGFVLKDTEPDDLVDAVRRLAAGMSNAEIADTLVVEVSTVKSHLGRAMAKIGARDRVQAVVWAHRNGMAPREP